MLTDISLELSGSRPVLDDIDDGADDLSRLVSTVSAQTLDDRTLCKYMIFPLQFSDFLYGMPRLSSGPSSDFLETYNQLVDEWVTSVPHGIHGVPNQTRVLKEKSARGVALDLLLSRLIRVSNPPSDNPPKSADSGWAENEPPAPQEDSHVQPVSSQVSDFERVTTRDHSSQFSTDRADDNRSRESAIPDYSNVSTYTTFKEPRPMPRNVANLLSHWQVGSDPSSYEWQKTSQLLEDEEVPGPSAPKQRARKRRSQLTPAPEALSLPPTPVAPMIRTWGSQPDHPVPKLPLASSQPTVDDVPMTQTERGQFGAREAKKNIKLKKKRRAAGF